MYSTNYFKIYILLKSKYLLRYNQNLFIYCNHMNPYEVNVTQQLNVLLILDYFVFGYTFDFKYLP